MDGQKWKLVHGGLFLFWIALWIVASLTGWIESVAFVSHISMIALVLASVSSWQAARTEEKEDERD